MKIILTALYQEARSIVGSLNLKKDPQCKKIPVYASGDTVLVISGMGKLSAAIATTYALHLAGKDHETQIINIGMCGSVRQCFPLGKSLMVNKIREQTSGREFFPDMLLQTGLEEASLETWDKPVTAGMGSQITCDLVDMEAFGIFQAGIHFVSPHQMIFVKIVTDLLDFSPDNFPQMLQYYEQALERCWSVLQGPFPVSQKESLLDSEDRELLSRVSSAMRLTETQAHQLKSAATGYLIRGAGDLGILEPMLRVSLRHKTQRNQAFVRLIRELNG